MKIQEPVEAWLFTSRFSESNGALTFTELESRDTSKKQGRPAGGGPA